MHEVFEHTADIGLRVRAASLEALLCDAAIGLFSLIVSNLDEVQPLEQVQLQIAGRQDEPHYLLFDWLNELLYLFDSRRIVLNKFELHLTHRGIEARAWGAPLDPSRFALEHEVKAITYHGLKVEREANGWLAEVILDI